MRDYLLGLKNRLMPRITGRCQDAEWELEMAPEPEIEAYIEQTNEAHGNDDPHPTANGRSPTFKEMAQYLLAAAAM